MTSGETQNPPTLYELDYPNDLRGDEAAITYVDVNGYTYLEPASGYQHDFDASAALVTVGLSSAEVVAVGPDRRQMLRYGPGADLLPLASLLNASMDREEASTDIVTSLEQVARLLVLAESRIGLVPQGLTRLGVALDRGLGRAELLAPYTRAEAGRGWRTAFDDLHADISQSGAPHQQQAIDQFFGAALLQLQSRRQ